MRIQVEREEEREKQSDAGMGKNTRREGGRGEIKEQ